MTAIARRPNEDPSNRVRRRLLLAGAALAIPRIGAAQPLAGKPVRLMVGAPPGGALDLVARLVAPGLAESLKTVVLVENKAGVSGLLNDDYVARSDPDGRTLLVGAGTPVVIAPLTNPKATFNPVRDLVAINRVGVTAQVLAVSPSLGVKSLKELLELARKQPISLASNGTGGFPHLTIELLIQASKVELIHVPYKGAGPAINDVLGGHVNGIVMDVSAVYPFIQQGRMVALAVTSDKPDEFLPGIATVSEQLAGFSVMNWQGLFAPAKTPSPIVNAIQDALVKVLARDEVRAALRKNAIIASPMASPAAFQQFIAMEFERWGQLVKEKHIVAQE